MSEALKQIISETQAAFIEDPSKGQEIFESSSSLRDGLRSDVSMRDHTLVVDEPEGLGGGDAEPNPVELVLAALGSCQEITYKAYAVALGIPLDSVSVKLEGSIDLRGFFGVDDSVRPGYDGIKGKVHIETSASQEEIEKLRGIVNAHCPVLDILTNPVPVELEIALGAPAAEAAQ